MRQRNITKYLEEYARKFSGGGNPFYPSDICAVLDATDNPQCCTDDIITALKYGYMTGYKAAEREAREKRRKARQVPAD